MKITQRTYVLNRLASLIWEGSVSGTEFYSADNHTIVLHSSGVRTYENSPVFSSASFSLDGQEFRGNVIFGDSKVFASEGEVLQIAATPDSLGMLNSQGDLIPKFLMTIDLEIQNLMFYLVDNCSRGACADFLSSMESFDRYHILNSLLYERLLDKYCELMLFHEQSDKNWNQTLHIMFFRAMGSPVNKRPFVELAKRIPYDVIAHNRDSLMDLEALLYGGSGLLQTRSDNFEYIGKLKESFSHLSHKYNIRPLRSGAWALNSSSRKGRPVTRLMQTAAFLHSSDFLFDKIMRLTDVKEIYSLFAAETSAFWRENPDAPERIGKDRQETLAINLVTPIMFAYAKSLGNEEMQEAAVDLLYKIPAEKNTIINDWRKRGFQPEDSAETQALIQINNTCCIEKRCADCKLGKAQIRALIKRKRLIKENS